MDDETLHEIQDNLLRSSKDILLNEGKMAPIAFLVTDPIKVEGAKEGGRFAVEHFDENDKDRETKPGDYAIVAFNMAMSDLDIMNHLFAIQPNVEDLIKEAVYVGQTVFHMSENEAVTRTLELFLKTIGADRKDVTARALKDLAEKVGAEAVIFTAEAYAVRMENPTDRDKFADDLEKDDRSEEVLTSLMDTQTFKRSIQVAILREPSLPGGARDSGKITGFGEPRIVVITPEDKVSKVTGRFNDLVTPFD